MYGPALHSNHVQARCLQVTCRCAIRLSSLFNYVRARSKYGLALCTGPFHVRARSMCGLVHVRARSMYGLVPCTGSVMYGRALYTGAYYRCDHVQGCFISFPSTPYLFHHHFFISFSSYTITLIWLFSYPSFNTPAQWI